MSRTQDEEGGGVGLSGKAARPGGRAALVIRPARQADLPALGEFFAGLSASTRYLRFFSPVTPGAVMLGLLSGGSGQADAVVAVRDGAIIGHAMAVDRAEPGASGGPPQPVTDIGVVVADAWQRQGVGSALTRALITRARARGVTSAMMDVLHGNQQVVAMIAAHWPAARVTRTPDCIIISCPLVPLASVAPRPAGHQEQRAAKSFVPAAAAS